MLCAVTIPHADLRLLSLYYYAVCGHVCMSSVRVWCFSVGDLLVDFITSKKKTRYKIHWSAA